jgi:hypothetical protein
MAAPTQYIVISAGLDDADITVDDWEYEDAGGRKQRVCNVNVGRVALMCGSTDAERVASLDRLIAAATKLRESAVDRIGFAEQTAMRCEPCDEGTPRPLETHRHTCEAVPA